MDYSKIEKGVEMILQGMEVDLTDPNFIETPERVAKFYKEMFEPKETNYAVFPEEYTDFIMLRRHRMFSLCPHHLLPVEFFVSLAYIPAGRVLGLSKLARVLDDCNTEPLLQERFTKKAVEAIRELSKDCVGAACLVEGQHGCTKIRGVRSDAWFVTYRLEGFFQNDERLEQRFFDLARRTV